MPRYISSFTDFVISTLTYTETVLSETEVNKRMICNVNEINIKFRFEIVFHFHRWRLLSRIANQFSMLMCTVVFLLKCHIFIQFRTLLNAEKELLGGLGQLAEIWNTVNQPASLALHFNLAHYQIYHARNSIELKVIWIDWCLYWIVLTLGLHSGNQTNIIVATS